MPDASVENRLSFFNIPFPTSRTIPADGVNYKEYTAPVAKTGALAVRSSVSVGTITGQSGHGITTASRFSLGWQNTDGTFGSRTNVLAGTVSGLSIPFTAGSGDDLPAQDTAVTVQIPHEEDMVLTGDNIQYIAAKCSRQGTIEVIDDAAIIQLVVPDLDYAAGNGYQWYNGSTTNPLASTDIMKVRFANLDSVYTNNLVFGAGYN